MKRKEIILLILVVIITWVIVVTIVNTLQHRSKLPEESDIVIVGGGVAGCVLARRLKEKYPHMTIAILDRGKDYRNDRNVYRSENAINIAFSLPYSEIIVPTDVETSKLDVSCSVPIMFGGGSSHNLGLAVEASDYFHESSWGPKLDTTRTELDSLSIKIKTLMDITPLPITIDLFARLLPALGTLVSKGITEIKQGLDVIQHVGSLRANKDISTWIHDAMKVSITTINPQVEDYNSGIGPCVSDTPQIFVDKVLGVRASVNRAYLPLSDTDKYKKVETATVSKIVASNGSKKMSVILNDGRKIVANKKIIMATGAVYTPLILLNSPSLNNVEYNAIKSNIGQNLTSHYGCTLVLAVKPAGLDYVAKGVDFSSGPLGFFSRPGRDSKMREWQIVVSGSTLTNFDFLRNQGIDIESYQSLGYNFITFLGWNLTPQARGSVSNVGTSTTIKPKITLNLFENSDDNDSIVELLRFMKRIASSMINTKNTLVNTKLQDVQILFPSPSVLIRNNYDELLFAAKEGVSLTDHYCSTASYETVLNKDFSLKGYPNIHIVDASAFPSIPDGNTEFPVLLMAELGSTRI